MKKVGLLYCDMNVLYGYLHTSTSPLVSPKITATYTSEIHPHNKMENPNKINVINSYYKNRNRS